MKVWLKEGVAFEDVKVPGMVVRRARSGAVQAYPKRTYRRRKAAPVGPETPMARVAARWAQVDAAGGDAWDAYAEVLFRRAGHRGTRLSGYSAFVRVAMAALGADGVGEPPLVPPALPARKRSPRKPGATPPLPLPKGREV